MKELLKLLDATAEKTRALAASQSVTEAPTVMDGVTVIPVCKLSCGFAGGGSDIASRHKNDAAAAGAGGKVSKTPVAFLTVEGNRARILPVPGAPSERVSLADAVSSVAALLREKKRGAAK